MVRALKPSSHYRIALIAAIAAALARFSIDAPPPPTLKGVADMLAASCHRQVGARDFLWEPSGGLINDTVFGRRLLFLANPSDSAPHDVFRATVRVSPEGRPLSIENIVNLTSSPLGDSRGLIAYRNYAAFSTSAYGLVQKVTILDLNGDFPETSQLSIPERIMGRLTRLQESGSFDGLGRTELSIEQPSTSATIALDNVNLKIALQDPRSRVSVKLSSGEVVADPPASQPIASAMQVPYLPKLPIIWAVDTVRAVTGPAPIAWLEEQVFGLKDSAKQLSFKLRGQHQDPKQLTLNDLPAAPLPSPPKVIGTDGLAQDNSWPPQNLRSMWKESEPNEGKWEPVDVPFLKRLVVPGAKTKAPKYYYQTYVRTDPKRPYSKVLLVAMDSRQLSLSMEGGIEDPKPLTGARGEGRIPRDPQILSRTVGAFNGAFKSTHGEYGMMVNKRVLLPPKAQAATVITTTDGRVGLGSWPASENIPEYVVSFRQNLEPLVDDSKLNPSGRQQWGFQLPGTSMLTHRSGLCVTASGHMIYAWGEEVAAPTLGNAMILAGCVYGIHLDMNPHHTAFAFLDIRNPAKHDFDAKILTPEMEVAPERFIFWSPKDFFYLTLRNYGPSEIAGVNLEADDGLQPEPKWAPSVYAANITADHNSPVRLLGFDASRAGFHLRSGTKGLDSPQMQSLIQADEAKGVIAAIGLGNPSKAGALGARVNGVQSAAFGSGALLVASPDKGLRIVAQGSPIVESEDAFELPVLRISQKRSSLVAVRGTVRSLAAACFDKNNYLWVAQTTAVSHEGLVSALEKTGCDLIVSLDRGAHEQAFVARAGTPNAPVDRYEQAALYVVARPMRSGAFHWHGPPGLGASASVLGTDAGFVAP